jgi:hypothetical protein
MRLLDYSKRLLSIAETVHRWAAMLAALDRTQRIRVARYAEAIADTLQRAAGFSARLTAAPGNRMARRGLARELGRITGYLETIVGVLRHHLDGRKLAGVKRRLKQLSSLETGEMARASTANVRVDRLLAAEGYFRALADSLRT